MPPDLAWARRYHEGGRSELPLRGNAGGQATRGSMRNQLLMSLTLVLIAVGCVQVDYRLACFAGERLFLSPDDDVSMADLASVDLASRDGHIRTVTCSRVSRLDLAVSRGDRWAWGHHLLEHIINSADTTAIKPRLLLAVLIRESGDMHSVDDWLSETLFGRLHDFSVGIANMKSPAFEEARAYSSGAIDFDWTAIKTDPAKAIRAAAFLLAKRQSQLDPRRSPRFTDEEYIRVGYRAGLAAMEQTQLTGRYAPGVELFDMAYATAGRLLPSALGPAAAAQVFARVR
jgi:hypothetical protein